MAVNTSQPILYGIPNCDTVKKAERWLNQQGIAYSFHDIRTQPLSAEQWQALVTLVGPETIINKRSTSWRGLSESEQQLASVEAVVSLLQQYPTLMKRPLVTPTAPTKPNTFVIGFKEAAWAQEFQTA
ncbi:Spx/MgsR family RNA polymerase-binding regulatory protein [Pseudidiomarina aestuarii]|uniref:Spx/MgsR family RNA polymerase-binding regulatory protein n=1 Tax=Pseudidiomarina aestuarii TaxID=624146 RepID=UPI003A9805B0